ncbi:sarcosine oxidase, alpha subunit family [Methylocella silvestris BL2]|uniref:Sarcosine oxidase, alpha subunit family n=1 Tax=Methylocella silvestris (strain DSM 15510 / CIP 108128 / LMG 27833 / NCIMB 13906 / BL2) TaxID=395965 RepID=B8EQ71_METSB|nr:sarcosine oxidase subunit alpha family protein [Methylocella silvestris]ACK51561.1 sarcosine oxidase, alpha subunit family [Methylocella silvestris BL2]
MSGFRLKDGGLIDRSRPLKFTFDGKAYSGYFGDTLASALIANGVRLVGRSFKYHRPRGVLSAGHEEPNALVELRQGARREPNVKATTIELYDGLVARSQNRWPSLAFDAMAVNGLLKPIFSAGFYYKTFMWPASFWEKLYEPVIRRAAGLGRASGIEDPDTYERSNAHCDVLVAGAGPAGLMAALTAARAGASVILCEDQPRVGGQLLSDRELIDGKPAPEWAVSAAAELAALPNVRIMLRTTVAAAFDGCFAALERVSDHYPEPPAFQPRQRFWRIVAKRTILAAGSTERPLPFPDNDRPGIMLSSAVRTYLNRFGAAAGRAMAIYTSTDDGWLTARDFLRAGLTPVVLVDTRASAPAAFADVAKAVPVMLAGSIVGTESAKGLSAITVEAGGAQKRFEVDALAVSGGFNPAIQLASHFGGKPVWSEDISAFLAGATAQGVEPVGAAAGVFGLAETFAQAAAAGAAGLAAPAPKLPTVAQTATAGALATWRPDPAKDGKIFVDLQHDVTASDVVLAHREGYRSVEHLKRYTTLGMATDQGRTANIDALAMMAELTGRTIPETGVTLARPPVVPIALGAVAGDHRRGAFRPVRETAIHALSSEAGAPFVDVGQWKRPQYFPIPEDADLAATAAREVETVRTRVGVTDVSTLGKIEVLGADAGAFLDRVCATRASSIRPGRCGYFVMLREDGFMMDDGMIARFAPDHFLVYASTAHAASVYRHMLYCRQALWPELDVNLAAVTDGWAQLAIAGPSSPAVVQALVDAPRAITRTTFPPMSAAEITICDGVPARLCALSFSGERAFEVAVPAGYGAALFRRILEVGAAYGIAPYGSEAMGVMRIEKGHPAGAEINGQTTAYDLGLARALSRDKDHIGRVLSARPALNDRKRARLVGLTPLDPNDRLRAGAHVIEKGVAPSAESDLGWLSSAAWSPTLRSFIALGFVSGGPDRLGEEVRIFDPVRGGDCPARIVAPCFYDPNGERPRV